MFSKIRADMKRYKEYGGWARNTGFWITAIYRFGSFSHTIKYRPLRFACLVFHQGLAFPVRVTKDVLLPASAKIGGGLQMPHPHSIYVPATSSLGENCTLFHEVTLGKGGAIPGSPTIGDNVSISPGSKILGGVTLGAGVTVGPNTVVLRNVKPGAIVSMPPATAIPGNIAARFKKKAITEQES